MQSMLESKRIRIRKLQLADAPSIYRGIRHKAVARWMPTVPHPYPKNAAAAFILRSRREWKAGKAYHFGIAFRETDEVIGGIGLNNVERKSRGAELGYWLGQRWWGRGIAAEAVRLALSFGFNQLKLHRVWARVIEGNKRSVRILEKAGFRYQGTLRESVRKGKAWCHELRFSLLGKNEGRGDG